jgi:hypothetical protein
MDQRLKDLRGESRRRFLKFTAAAGAALALDQSEVLDFLAQSGGHALADGAACASKTNRSVHIVAGNGGFAWFQLLFPHNEIAAAANDGFAFHANGQAKLATDTDKPFTFAPETPWQKLGPQKRVSAFMAGSNETHTAQPQSASTLDGGVGMLAATTALQGQLSSLLPVIGVAPFNFGNAAGAPEVTTVGEPEQMVELFNSAASRALLSVPKDAALYEAYYKAFLGLNRAARLPTWQKQLRITKASANFLGKNLADQLRATAEDLLRYGVDGGAASKLRELATGLVVTAKAFQLGLTNCVILPAMRDDPHGAFGDMPNLLATVATLGKMLDAFLDDLALVPDPGCTGKSLADTTVLTIHGDTPKNPRDRSGWPDGTPGNVNWMYVLGAGLTKTGWFGGVKADGSVVGFDPTTGNDVPDQPSAATASAASAAVLYAVTQGDLVRVQQFYNGPSLKGIVHEKLM